MSTIAGYRIEGHAIVSIDDRIAGPDGMTPTSLHNHADWHRFQGALDAAAIVVLGRLSHEANRNTSERNRLVISSSASGVEQRDDAWWWNPEDTPLRVALLTAAPDGGIVAVPGGRLAFDLFLKLGFDAFHLARATEVHIPGGIPVFSDIADGRNADDVLTLAGMVPDPAETLDSVAGVTLVTWRRPAA